MSRTDATLSTPLPKASVTKLKDDEVSDPETPWLAEWPFRAFSFDKASVLWWSVECGTWREAYDTALTNYGRAVPR